MTGVTEVTGTSYARQLLSNNTTDWPSLTLQSSEVAVDSKQITFTAGGTWTTYNYVFLDDYIFGHFWPADRVLGRGYCPCVGFWRKLQADASDHARLKI